MQQRNRTLRPSSASMRPGLTPTAKLQPCGVSNNDAHQSCRMEHCAPHQLKMALTARSNRRRQSATPPDLPAVPASRSMGMKSLPFLGLNFPCPRNGRKFASRTALSKQKHPQERPQYRAAFWGCMFLHSLSDGGVRRSLHRVGLIVPPTAPPPSPRPGSSTPASRAACR